MIGRPETGPGPMLTALDDLPDAVATYLAANADRIDGAVTFGGVNAVGESVEGEIDLALGAARSSR